MFSDFKSKHIINGAIAQIDIKQDKLTCESNPSVDPNTKINISNVLFLYDIFIFFHV